MKRYIPILIMAISIAVTSCNNMLVKEPAAQEEKARVSLAVGNPSSRTILPEAYDEVASLENFTFTATSTAGEDVTHTFTNYNTLQTAQLFFTPDTYDCSLSVTSTAGVRYEGVLEDKVIAPGDNVLAFTLQVVQLSAEPGSLEVQLTFPGEKVQVVKAGLYSITGEVLSGFSEEVLEITNGNTVTYSNASVPGGNHLIKFSFYGDDECSIFLGMHTESVVIISDQKSAAIRSIESINPMYTITYELNGGAFVEGYAEPDKFIPNMEIQLPTMFEVSKDNNCFLGWYEDADFSGAPVDTILRGTGENKTFYAKWALGKIVTADTVSTLDLSSTSGEYWVIVTGAINSSTISTLKAKLTAAGETAKIHLDLSQTTGLTSIDSGAFYYCIGLTSVEIPAGVTSIGASAFYYCSGLTSVEIPAGVTSIGNYAFYYCSGLTSVEIPAGVTSIGNYAFVRCYGLTSMEIPSSVTNIGEEAFSWCFGLTSVVIPAGVTSIGEHAFYECRVLTSVYYQGDLARWCEGFGSGVSSGYGDNRNLYINGKLVQGDLVIPAGVTSIGDAAFNDCSGLTSVVIPSSVTSIGDAAFSGCSGLTSVVIPSSVTSIGGAAFSGCSGLTSVVIPSSVTSIGVTAFYGCSSLTSVKIPDGVTSIGELAFSGCSGLTSVVIPSSVTSIDSWAFEDCSGLASVTFEAGSQLESICSYAFSGCSGLTSVEIPASVTSIGEYAFDGCRVLTSVYYQGDLARWCEGFGSEYSYLMVYCRNLYINGELVQGDLVIPAGVTSIGKYAFSDCSWLTSVEIPSSVTSIGDYAFRDCSGLTSVYYQGDLARWCEGFWSGHSFLMHYCRNLYINGELVQGDLVIPAGVTSIGYVAFSGCSEVTSVEIPSSVTSIDNYAFSGCSGLTSVTFGDINGWYVTKSSTDWSNKTGGTAVTLSATDLAANAELVRSTYVGYYWYKVD